MKAMLGRRPRAAAARRDRFDTREAPGIIDTGNTALYYVLDRGRAVRYGVGVGREGLVRRADHQPQGGMADWHPPAEMIARQPYLPRFMAGGPGNPWARARCISAPASIAFTA
jgi:lipoprotein-anchoring transpeptidase ErfK/SrfK